MFYDGACPLCRREVAHYRRLDRRGRVAWVDISRDTAALRRHGIDPGAAMARLHALDEEGRVVTGAAAFAAVWRGLPGYRHLARLVQGLGLIPLLDRLYDRFAAWRLGRRCRDGQCAPRR
jgi:predicted DCC family thiol-disulfide oxidoreductase YuxK